jgi:hypothetical protein
LLHLLELPLLMIAHKLNKLLVLMMLELLMHHVRKLLKLEDQIWLLI